jgi:ubiquitin-protein ligase E3 A
MLVVFFLSCRALSCAVVRRQAARYEDGYDAKSPVIKWFWEVVHEFSEEEKKKFLAFCTGSDRVPIKGLGALTLVISKNGTDGTRLPTSHTCFNHILLPGYNDQAILKKMLTLAINHSQGFGLR